MILRKLSALVALLVLSGIAFASDPSILVGQWKFNAQESDRAPDKIREAMQNANSGFGNEQTEQPHGHRGGFRGGPPKEGEHESNPFEPPDTITITYTAPEVKVVDSKGMERVYYTDGRKSEAEGWHGRKLAFYSKWQDDDSLLIESEGPQGGALSRNYYLSPDAKKLYIKTRMQPLMLDKPVTIIEVYDSAPAQTETQTQTQPQMQTQP